jgi:hypothetical protein
MTEASSRGPTQTLRALGTASWPRRGTTGTLSDGFDFRMAAGVRPAPLLAGRADCISLSGRFEQSARQVTRAVQDALDFQDFVIRPVEDQMHTEAPSQTERPNTLQRSRAKSPPPPQGWMLCESGHRRIKCRQEAFRHVHGRVFKIPPILVREVCFRQGSDANAEAHLKFRAALRMRLSVAPP